MNKIIRLSLFIIVALFWGTATKAQTEKYIDSVETVLSTMKNDSNKVNLLTQTSWKIKAFKITKAYEFAEKALAIAKEINFKKGIADGYTLLGGYELGKGNYDKAKEYELKALSIFKELNNLFGQAKTNNFLGNIEYTKSNFKDAANYFILASKFAQKVGKEDMASAINNNIGMIYKVMGDYSQAIEYLNKSATYDEKEGDLDGLAGTYCNIGTIYIEQKEFDKAKNIYQKALELVTKTGNKQVLISVLMNFGTYYSHIEDYNTGITFVSRALEICKELGDQEGICLCYINNADSYLNLKNYKEAEKQSREGLVVALKIGNVECIRASYEGLSDVYEAQGNFTEAFKYIKIFHAFKDSIFNKENNDQITEMQTKYDSEKKAQEINLLNKDKEVQNTELDKQRTTRNFFIVLSALFILMAIVIFRSYRQKKNANTVLTILNTEISNQKKETETQKHIVEEKNKEITDSIHYAKRIQRALLTSDKYLKQHLPEHFIFYNPKDIVSGDFYWALKHNEHFLLITADCTGHGVPGAFMSLLGINFLNEITIEQNNSRPDEILNSLRTEIINALNPEGSEVESKDGMDATLCRFNFKTKTLDMAAANNPLWIVRDKNILEFKADKMPVGIYASEIKPFGLTTIQLQENDIVYSFTDGYADQFGGPQGKKFKYSQLKDLILTNCHLSMEEQQKLFAKTIEKWRGDLEQVDDILLIGIKI